MILVFCDVINPRIEYATRLIFSQILGVEVNFTTNKNEFFTSDLPKINYSGQKFGGEFYIKPNPLLFEKGISVQKIQPVQYKGEICFFESSEDSVFPFDPFAAAFFFATRYEEYGYSGNENFGRFPAGKSWLSKYNQLKKPVINIRANLLAESFRNISRSWFFPSVNLSSFPPSM